MPHTVKGHAVVQGAGVAGLLAARAGSGHFRSVTILENDARPVEGVSRAGVPQGYHTHILLPAGGSGWASC